QNLSKLGITLERLLPPPRVEVTPFGEAPRRDPQALDRPLPSTLGLAPQAPPDPRWRTLQHTLEPTPEGAPKHLFRMTLGEDLKGGVDTGLHGALAEDLGAEPVDRAHPGFLEVRDRVLEPRVFVAVARCILARELEPRADPELDLPRGLFREGHGHDTVHGRHSAREHRDDAMDQLRGLSGPGGGFDDHVPV